MVNEEKLCRAFMLTAWLVLVRLGVGSGAKCGDVFNKPLSSCCPTEHLHSCCQFTKPCNTSVTMRPRKPQQRGAEVKPFCMKPQNSTACEAGFFFNNVTKHVEPCPNGFYCAQDQVCIIPCPMGAYCVKDKLVKSTENSPQLCRESGKCCSPSQSIPLFDASNLSSMFICPGAKSPVPCPAGSYCPKVTVKKPCTGGHFCRNGTVEPQDCPFLSICKKGSSAPESAIAGIILILSILLLMLLLMYCFNHEERLASLFQRHVVQRCREIQRISKFKVQDPLKRLTSWLTLVEKYREGASPKKQTITIRFENLSLVLKKTKKDVLQGVTGQLLPGEVTAVMGPSGSGKTTLLNTLCGKAYYGKRGGRLYINNNEVNDLGVYRNITGFVPQEDVMHRSLTVNEVLIYQANLRLPSTISNDEKRRRIHEVLDLLDLKGVKNTKIGDEESRGISGGQRKRVNIGMELVTDPTLLFLDEPTSGLDSTSSLMVVDALKAVAEEKKLTIVCVIHQPRYEIFSKFHKVLFLAPGGKTVFQGTVPEAENYFERLGFEKPDKVNPADFYMDVIGGVFKSTHDDESEFPSLPDKWGQHASQNSAVSEGVVDAAGDPDSPVTKQADVRLDLSFNGSCAILIEENQDQQDRAMPNFLIQFFTFLRREIRLQFRLSRSLLLDQFLVLLAGGTLGALRKEAPLDEFFTLVTLSSLAIGLTAMLSSLRCFGSNRATFWREAASGINRVSYFVAVNVAQIPIILITPVVYLSLLYPLVSPRGYFRFHYAATLGAQFACTGVGYCISAIFNPKNSQMASVTFALICSLVSEVFNKAWSSCCPPEYLPFCCPGITKPCNKSATVPPIKPQRGVVVKPLCMKPQNSTACEAGFYFDNVRKQVEPCPDGFYCDQDKVCIIPCPKGAYCVRDELVDSTENSPQLCRETGKCCSPSQSIPLFDQFYLPSMYICPGAKKAVPCPEGSYCPKVTVKKLCTGGHFCRNGTEEPQKCPFLSICKKGSRAPQSTVAGIVLILFILMLMLLLIYCFNHEERLVFLFERHVVQRCREIQLPNFKVEHPLKRMASWISMVEKYREGASPKKQTITIRFENLSLVLKKVKFRWQKMRS